MIDSTRILRKLTSDEILGLKYDLERIDHLWADHSYDPIKYPTALREGKSIHLHNCDNDLVLWDSILDTVGSTKNIISDTIGSYHIGRVYWHRLMPGDSIDAHSDIEVKFVKTNKLVHRYQIYLECMPENILMLDAEYKNNKDFEYTVVDFALTKIHYYKNRSSVPWYLLVFDALNQPLV